MKIAVGSKNPVKVRPVKKIFSRYFNDIEVIPIDAPSGVSEQPLSEEETYNGALNRAKSALNKVPNAEFGIGIEGGIVQHPIAGFNEKSVVIIVNKKGEIGIGISSALFLPEEISRHINNGLTLNDAIDKVFGTTNIGKGIGAYGVFTRKVVTRATGVEDAIAFALSRFLHENLF